VSNERELADPVMVTRQAMGMTDEVKEYFRSPGTVAGWWNPDDERDPHFAHFREQLAWVIEQFDWHGAHVLDVGTGKGRFAVPFALNLGRVVAVDISIEMLAEARQRARCAEAAVEFVQGDAERLPFRSASFDVVSCMEMLMHVPRPQCAIGEVARVMHPRGRGVLSITNKWRLNALADLPVSMARALRLNRMPAGPRIAWYYGVGTFRRFVRAAGLRVDCLRGQGLLQPGARLRLTRRRSLPLVHPGFARWFFARVEPGLRQGPLLRVMGTIQATVSPEGGP